MKLIFYTLYKWFYYFNSLADPHFVAVSFYILFLSINVFTVYAYVDMRTESLNGVANMNLTYIAFCFLGLFVFSYIIFLKDKRYLRIEERFDRNKYAFITGNVITVLYILASVGACLWMLYLYRPE